MIKKIRYTKLFLGSLLLGLFVTGCANEKSKTPDKKCYVPSRSVDSVMAAREDSTLRADSIHKADSVKKHKRSDMSGCYMPRKVKN
ncbi:MAG: hypothetical protein V2A54_15205 [Bacteroidota bacterium]